MDGFSNALLIYSLLTLQPRLPIPSKFCSKAFLRMGTGGRDLDRALDKGFLEKSGRPRARAGLGSTSSAAILQQNDLSNANAIRVNSRGDAGNLDRRRNSAARPSCPDPQQRY